MLKQNIGLNYVAGASSYISEICSGMLIVQIMYFMYMDSQIISNVKLHIHLEKCIFPFQDLKHQRTQHTVHTETYSKVLVTFT